jgi:hypothetical protein
LVRLEGQHERKKGATKEGNKRHVRGIERWLDEFPLLSLIFLIESTIPFLRTNTMEERSETPKNDDESCSTSKHKNRILTLDDSGRERSLIQQSKKEEI